MGLKYAKVRDVKSPERAGKREAGIDFYIPEDFKGALLNRGDSILIPMGIKVLLPEVPECLKDTHEYMLEFINKSGVAYKKGIVVGSRVIDATYQGELFLNLHNNTEMLYKPDGSVKFNGVVELCAGDSIVQGVLILVNTEEIGELPEDELFVVESQRGAQGFGSDYKEK